MAVLGTLAYRLCLGAALSRGRGKPAAEPNTVQEVRMITPKFFVMSSLIAAALAVSALILTANPFPAIADDGSADVALGVKYLNGDGVPKDAAKALHYFQQAANLGNADGENDLGVLYDKGIGVALDYATALRWFKRAAAQGNANANFAIGVIYDDGHGVSTDYTTAMHYYRLAADHGVPNAKNSIGILYFEGHGVPQNYATALHWFGQAAAQHYSVAEDNVGLLYEQGHAVPQVYQIALYWDQMAVSDGDADAASDVRRVQALIDNFAFSQLPCGNDPIQAEQKAVAETQARSFPAAFANFMTALYFRESCVPKTNGDAQQWNIYYAGFDQFGLSKATIDAFTRSYFQDHAHVIAGNLLKANVGSDLQAVVQTLFNDTK
jgi:TPR repeat protein